VPRNCPACYGCRRTSTASRSRCPKPRTCFSIDRARSRTHEQRLCCISDLASEGEPDDALSPICEGLHPSVTLDSRGADPIGFDEAIL
jgi:hypothetical protein